MPRATTTEPKSKLLPSEIGDFRSKGFWQQFFEARGGKAFEWYGAWVNFAPNFFALAPDTSVRILVVGCGNSGMSAQLYAAGYTNVTNVDFDAGVIDEMRRKHAEKCPKMQWLVMDVTAMHDLADGAFDVVLDKGTMDAMFTDASADVLASIDGMLREVRRLLAPGGLYLVVTLAQEHLLRHWATRMAVASADASSAADGAATSAAAASAPGWTHVHVDTFSVADLSSNRCQFVLTARKPVRSAGVDGAALAASGAAPGAESSPAGAAASAGAPTARITVHSPHSFEDAAPPAALLKKPSGAAAGSGAAGGGAKGGKKGAGAASGGAASAAATGAAAAAGTASTLSVPAAGAEWVCVHASGEETVSVDFPPLPAGGLPSDAPAAAAAAAVDRLVAEVGEVQWAYSTARALSSVHPDNYLSVDVWPLSALSAAATGGAGGASGGGSGGPVMVTPAGVKPKLLREEGAASAAGRAAPAAAPSASEGSAAAPAPQQLQREFPRFTITVVDVSLAPSAAVVLIPQGREHEWLFASREGQRQVAASARAYGRVIFVALGRGHAFPGGPKAVQDELTPTIVRFLPPALRPSTGSGKGGRGGGAAAGSVPYLAVADDIGSRQVVAQGTSALSGGYVVEDVEVEPEEGEAEDAAGAEEEAEAGAGAGAAEGAGSRSGAGAAADGSGSKSKGKPTKAAPTAAKRAPPLHLRRRLVFLSNRNAVQSEAFLRIPAAAAASLAAVKGVDERIAHASAAARVDASRLCFEYQQAMAAVVRLYCRGVVGSGGSVAASAAAEPLRVCVVGLGSGALASFLAAQAPAAVSAASGGRFSHVDVTAVELDGEVVALAQRHFAFRARAVDGETPASAEVAPAAAASSAEGAPDSHVRVVVGDGLVHLQAFAAADATAAAAPSDAASAASSAGGPLPQPQPYHVLIVDVDAKDLATAISFPPPAFLARQALAHMRAAVTRQQQTAGVCGATEAVPAAAAAPTACPAPGLVLINFSCRSAPLKKAILASLQRAFAAPAVAASPEAASAAGGSAASAGAGASAPAAASADAGVVLEVSLESAVPDASNSLIAATTSPALAAALADAAAAASAAAVAPAGTPGGGRAAAFWQRYEREWAPLVHRVPAA